MTTSSFDAPGRGPVRRVRSRTTFVLIGLLVAIATALAAGSGFAASGKQAATPVKGGTLKLLGTSDIFNLDTTSAYYTVSNILERSYTRQLVGYRNSPSFLQSIQVVPDVATAVPTVANGGITDGGKTYTLHLRSGVMWNTTPARAVVAGDFVREFQMLCNPASPTGAPGYYTSTIVGMKAYCAGFANVKPTVAAINGYVSAHSSMLTGVSAPNASTVVFHLVGPAPDFTNILAMPFSSARPVEYNQYVPDSAQFRQHTLSDGPYEITKYVATKEFVLARNPAWNPASDPLRKAYVDGMTVTEGISQANVQQQLEAGTGDMDWDVLPPSQDLPALQAKHDPNLVIGPTGPYYVALQTYLAMNEFAGPFKNKLVRQAANYAVDKVAIAQIYGGPTIAIPANQVVLPGNVGFIKNYNPYPDNNGNGDPAKSKALLAKAGFPNGVPIKLLYSTTDPGPRVAQALQASLNAGGFKVSLVSATQSDFYGKYLLSINTAKRDVWDMAPPGWIPDWFGNNGRSVVQPLFSSPGNGSSDYSGYNSPIFNGYLSKALTAPSPAVAATYWQKANAQIMKDAATVPVEFQKYPAYHSSRVQGCTFFFLDLNCDPTNVWLKG
jgi:peptide/nickel transport system substrate-binding protein